LFKILDSVSRLAGTERHNGNYNTASKAGIQELAWTPESGPDLIRDSSG
jgi:hypothetical protein